MSFILSRDKSKTRLEQFETGNGKGPVAVLFVSILQNTVRKASKFLSQPLVDIMRSAEPDQVYSVCVYVNDATFSCFLHLFNRRGSKIYLDNHFRILVYLM